MAHWHVHVPEKIIRDPRFAFDDFNRFSVQLPKVFHHSAYFCMLCGRGMSTNYQLSSLVANTFPVRWN